MRIENKVRRIAISEGWEEIPDVKDPTMVSFTKILRRYGKARINVWYTKMTVGTYIHHPYQGRTQLFRKNVDGSLLRSIFKNPRVHSNRGYKHKYL